MIKAKKIKTAIITHTKEFLSDESGMEFLQLAIVIVIVAGLMKGCGIGKKIVVVGEK